MKLTSNEVKKLLAKSFPTNNPKISFLAEGFGNYNYLIKDEEKKYIFRIKKSSEKQFNDSLEREYVFLKFFEDQGINFCPKVILYNKENNYLIEKFIEWKEISQKNFSKEEIDLFAKQLHQLFYLNVETFFEYCKKNNFKIFSYKNPLESFQKYGINRFKQIKKENIDKKVFEWLDEKVKTTQKKLENIEDKWTLWFSWWDIQSKVIINNINQMFFYDFEFVGISTSPGLSYIKIHGDFDKEQFEYLIERYAHYAKESKRSILQKIKNEEETIRIDDVVWAEMKRSETKQDKFKELTYKRVNLVENL